MYITASGIGTMSLSAGLLALAVIAVRAAALNRLPKNVFLLLWGIVLFRLLIPVSIPSPFGAFPGIESLTGENIRWNTKNIFAPTTPPVEGIAEIKYETENPPPSYETASDLYRPTERDTPWRITPAAAVWLAGTLAAALFFAAAYYRNHRALRYALKVGDNAAYDAWRALNRVKRPIPLLRSDRITTPVAVGTVRPRIILPQAMDADDQPLMRYVLTHEYAHITRGDAFWKLLLTAALCIHWFNPLVWVMFALVNRDLELACDETVIRRLGAEDRTGYAYSLIGMAEQRRRFTPLYSGYSKSAAEERIVSIMKYKKHSAKTFVAAGFCVAAAFLLFTASALTVRAGGGDRETGAYRGAIPDSASSARLGYANSPYQWQTGSTDLFSRTAGNSSPGDSSAEPNPSQTTGNPSTGDGSAASNPSQAVREVIVGFHYDGYYGDRGGRDEMPAVAVIEPGSGRVWLYPEPRGRDANFYDTESNYITSRAAR